MEVGQRVGALSLGCQGEVTSPGCLAVPGVPKGYLLVSVGESLTWEPVMVSLRGL